MSDTLVPDPFKVALKEKIQRARSFRKPVVTVGHTGGEVKTIALERKWVREERYDIIYRLIEMHCSNIPHAIGLDLSLDISGGTYFEIWDLASLTERHDVSE